MTDISISPPIATRRPSLPKLCLPRLDIGARIAGLSGLLGNAFSMAYVEPYASFRRQPQIVSDDDLEGRDPRW